MFFLIAIDHNRLTFLEAVRSAGRWGGLGWPMRSPRLFALAGAAVQDGLARRHDTRLFD